MTSSTAAVETALEIHDLADHSELADIEADRRLFWACVTTLLAPINFLVEALVYWDYGWPSAGPPVFVLMVGMALTTWVWWVRARSESQALDRALVELLDASKELVSRLSTERELVGATAATAATGPRDAQPA